MAHFNRWFSSYESKMKQRKAKDKRWRETWEKSEHKAGHQINYRQEPKVTTQTKLQQYDVFTVSLTVIRWHSYVKYTLLFTLLLRVSYFEDFLIWTSCLGCGAYWHFRSREGTNEEVMWGSCEGEITILKKEPNGRQKKNSVYTKGELWEIEQSVQASWVL